MASDAEGGGGEGKGGREVVRSHCGCVGRSSIASEMSWPAVRVVHQRMPTSFVLVQTFELFVDHANELGTFGICGALNRFRRSLL